MNFFFAGLGYGSIIPDASGGESHSLTKRFAERIGICVDQYIEAMEKVISCANESFLYSYILLFFPFLHYDLRRSCVISDQFDITGQAKASTENCNEHIQ